MNQIEKLIQQYCPEGVEYKELGEVCNILNGYAFKSKNFNTEGQGLPLIRIRDINTGFSGTYYSGEYDDKYLVYNGDIVIGMDGDFVAARWNHGKALLNQRVCKLEDYNGIVKDFLFYLLYDVLKTIQDSTSKTTVKHLSTKTLQTFKIPFPPLPVQEAIVEILDRFTELETELETELVKRQQQYEYYRDELLTFGPDEVEWKTLGEVGEFIRGSGLPKSDFTESGVGCIHYGQIYTFYGVNAKSTISFVSSKTAQKLKKAKFGDLIITNTSENLEDVGKSVAWLGNEEICIGGHESLYRSSRVKNTFLAYYTRTRKFFDQKRRLAKGTKVIDVSANDMKKITIPIPPLKEQERIVAILDRFDALTNSLSEGLPAEIEARRQQYEYYRDQLLTFEEKA